MRQLRHVILDRDGVLNREPPDGGYVRAPEQFEWLPGALEGLAMLKQAGMRLTVVTNQAGVGRGLMSLAGLAAVHARLRAEASVHGGAPDEVLFCPHAPQEGCECRKPAPGLIRQAIAAAGIPAAETLVIGDDGRDLEAARRAGVAAALVRTGKGRLTEQRPEAADVPVYDDLLALARIVTGR